MRVRRHPFKETSVADGPHKASFKPSVAGYPSGVDTSCSIEKCSSLASTALKTSCHLQEMMLACA